MDKKLMSGNEAIARGAYEAGVKVAAAYPGTPSTEILENLSRYPEVYAEWAPNEKVALEVGLGASIAGSRVLVAMKHVGVNVAADPLMTAAYTGVNGGLVLISADDPGAHSSQNEQDNRYYAKFAQIPLLEPSDSQEAKDMVAEALEISEQFDTPVMLRTTTRINHSQSLVEPGEPRPTELRPYKKNSAKYVMAPANARPAHKKVLERTENLRSYAESSKFNRREKGSGEDGNKIGIIASGVAYQYVKEKYPEASCLKLGMTNPLPERLIREFAASVDELFAAEELEPFLEEQIRAMGITVKGKELLPRCGEFQPQMLRALTDTAADEDQKEEKESINVPGRAPVLCPGCPHRPVFYALRRSKLTVTGDIGCYTLGAGAPLSAIDTVICMGASISGALGMEKARPDLKGRLVAVIGDSTFLHSGMTGLLDIVYNQGSSTVIILDNRITAMTGHQDNPSTGKTLQGAQGTGVDLLQLVKALGVKRAQVADPFKYSEFEKILKEELQHDEPSVIIARSPCVLIEKRRGKPITASAGKCIGCGSCLDVGCPALSIADGKVQIDQTLCVGCGFCAQICPVQALGEKTDGRNGEE